MRKPRTSKKRPAPRREGMVLLIVLLILMMTTATATFAVHNTGYEIQASGNMRRALRTRNVSEAMASALMLRASEANSRFCAEAEAVQDELGGAFAINVEKFGYPAIGALAVDEIIGTYLVDSLAAGGRFENTPIPDDATLSSSSTASTYLPEARALVECKDMGAPAGENVGSTATTQRSFQRVRVTTFGMMAPTTDVTSGSAQRSDHETISISRVYMNLSE